MANTEKRERLEQRLATATDDERVRIVAELRELDDTPRAERTETR